MISCQKREREAKSSSDLLYIYNKHCKKANDEDNCWQTALEFERNMIIPQSVCLRRSKNGKKLVMLCFSKFHCRLWHSIVLLNILLQFGLDIIEAHATTTHRIYKLKWIFCCLDAHTWLLVKHTRKPLFSWCEYLL
jgi:hypothetical protein